MPNNLADSLGPYEFSGGEPKLKYVGRSLEVDRQMFDEFNKQSLGRKSSGLFTAFLQPRDQSEDLGNPRHYGQAPRHRSLLGLRIVSPYNTWASAWSIAVATVDATYVAFLVPIILAFFARDNKNSRDSNWMSILEICAGVIYTGDIIMNFHIGFIVQHNYKKKVVMRGESVCWYYATHGGLWIDMLSAFPVVFEIAAVIFVEEARVIDSLEIMRVFRLIRLTRILEGMYFTVFVGRVRRNPTLPRVPLSLVYLCAVLYTLAFMINFLGCLLYLTASLQDKEFYGTWMENHAGTDVQNYLTSIYWVVTTITTVGYGDISPKTWIEQIIVIFVMLTHIMLFGLLVGSMSELVKSSRRDAIVSEKYRTKIADVGDWIYSRKISTKMAQKVHAYYTEIWVKQNSFDESSILAELPMTLRSEIAFSLTRELLKGLSIFSEVHNAALQQLAGRLVPIELPPGHELVRQGDPADSIFIIQEGTVILSQNDAPLRRLVGPATCCESAILASEVPELSIHIQTVRAHTASYFWELKVKDLEPLLISYPALKDTLSEGYRLRMVQTLIEPVTTPSATEAAVEAELGLDIALSDAQKFKSELEATSGVDGTFPRLMKETFRRTRLKNLQPVAHATSSVLVPTGPPLPTRESKELTTVLEIIWEELPKHGVNGMIELHGMLMKFDALPDGIGLTELEFCMKKFNLTRRQLMKLLGECDPQDLGKFDVQYFARIVRARYLRANILSFLNNMFECLDNMKIGKLNVSQILNAFHVERHPDVARGTHTKGEIMMGLFPYFKDVDNISKDEFNALNLDMRVSMQYDNEFMGMEHRLWGLESSVMNE